MGYAAKTARTTTDEAVTQRFRIYSLDELAGFPSVDLNATCLELLTFIHGTSQYHGNAAGGGVVSYHLSLMSDEKVYYLSCPELVEESGVGLQGNPVLVRIPVDDPEKVHYRAQLSDDYAVFKGQKHISSLTFQLTDYAGRLVLLKGKPLSLLLTFSVD